MEKQLKDLLAYLSRRILRQYKPTIIGITGSVGKTSAKEAIFCVVSQKYSARRGLKNFNNEFGFPFAILGVDSPGKNPFLWIVLIAKALALIIFNLEFPKVLILEYGIDRPGDMAHLLSIARPNIAIITNIGLSHASYFKDFAALENEKGKLVAGVLPGGTIILNADNPQALNQKAKTKEKVLLYGLNDPADIKIFDVRENLRDAPAGISTTFSVKTPSKEFKCAIKTLGQPHVFSAAAAIAVGEVLNIDADLIVKGLKNYKPVPGRLNVISGIKKTIIIDDTYNAAPDSTKAALELLSRFPSPIKVAILGDMLELGALSEQKHLEIGKMAAGMNLQRLVTVGPQGKLIADGAKEAGMNSGKIISFDLSTQALNAVQNLLEPGDVILIKGSQGMRMEKITKEIMAEPMRAQELLCRQNEKWLRQ
jgi:UDP-N-acetylmuramoyl-tripeptide--D-alanyl-D-alanine ligase